MNESLMKRLIPLIFGGLFFLTEKHIHLFQNVCIYRFIYILPN